MSITHFDQLATLPTSFRSFEDAVARLLNEPRGTRPWSPSVDILETADELVLKADLPDVNLEDIEVRIENQTLTLKGERKFENEETTTGYHRIERNYGTFVRSFTLPASVDAEKVAAEYKNGVLIVKVSKKEAAKPRQVKVEVKGYKQEAVGHTG
jgi:HSP20 family protein